MIPSPGQSIAAEGDLPHRDQPAMAARTAALYARLPYPADGVVRSTTARILELALRRHFPRLAARLYSKLGRWQDSGVRDLLDRMLPLDNISGRYDCVTRLRLSPRHTFMDSAVRLWTRRKYGPPFTFWEFLQLMMKRSRINHVSDSYSCPCETYYTFGELRRTAEDAGWRFVALAPNGGLPTRPEELTTSRETLAYLQALPEDLLYDLFAFRFQAPGFTFLLRPS